MAPRQPELVPQPLSDPQSLTVPSGYHSVRDKTKHIYSVSYNVNVSLSLLKK